MLKVATYNVNSIRSRLHIVIPWLERKGADLLMMQETKVEDTKFPVGEFEKIGYHAVFHGRGGYSGIAIASKEELEGIEFGLFGSDPYRIVRGVYRGVHVINTYVPQGFRIESPKYRYKVEWLKELRKLLEKEYERGWKVLLGGDLNVAPESIDVHDPEGLKDHVDFHVEVRELFKELLSWGLVDLFRKYRPGEVKQYTFYDYRVRDAVKRGLGWRVDHLFATEPLAERSVDCYIDLEPRLSERPSDHTVLLAEFDI
ncbi:MAG: exodeoxyribonuclease III [Candidatus Korarchaeum sp.]|nr:exodeoxyribonuclease III [Candidatus Korarchaeum sp.]MDW8036098.1 exodeoxyribonuclease III [Candidatus Korarchaeum sp.]